MAGQNVRNISVRLGADVNNFVQGMQNANNKMSQVSTQMRTQFSKINANTDLMVERLKLTGKESEITAVKMQGLTSKISIQSGYVRRLSTELDVAKGKFGETSREVQKLELQLLRASKVEAQMKNELNSMKAPSLNTDSSGGGGGMMAGLMASRFGGLTASLGAGAGLATIAPPAALIAGVLALGSAMQSLIPKIQAASQQGIEYNAQMETMSTNMRVLLGDANKSKAMMADLKDFAAVTPFGTSDLAKSTQTLLAFGIAQNKIMPTLKMLGDVSLGDKQKLDSLTLAFGQVASTGRLMGGELNQLINAGFNPLQVISGKTKISMADLKKAMEDGKISAEMVGEAFKIATSEGGQFFKGMEEGSKTFNGQLSTLKDNVNTMLGTALKPMFNFLTNSVLPALNTAAINANNIFGGIAENFKSYSTRVQIQMNEQRVSQGKGILGWDPSKTSWSGEELSKLVPSGWDSGMKGLFTPDFKKIETVKNVLDDLPGIIKNLGSDGANSVKTAANKIENEMKSFVDKIRSQAEQFKNAFGLFDKASTEKVSGGTLLARLKGQLNILTSYKGNMETLKGKFGERSLIYQELLQKGPQAAGQVAALAKSSDSVLNSYSQAFNQKSGLAYDLASPAVSSQSISDKKTASVIVQIQNAYGDGVDELADKIINKLRMAGVY